MDTAAVLDAVSRLALEWRAMGLERGERVAILSENRPEWLLTDYALLGAGAVSVPIYTSLSTPQIEYILSNAGAAGIVVSSAELLARVTSIRARLPELRHVVAMDAPPGGDPSVIPFREMIRRGGELRLRDPDAFHRIAAAARPEDLASIIYTSGTTGPPKGVMLSHGNFASKVEATRKLFDFTPADRALSFLPLSHIFERTADYVFMRCGVTIVHVALEHLLDCLPSMRPTVIASVPRLFEKMREKIESKAAGASPLQRRLFIWAREAGRETRLAPLTGGAPPGAGARLRGAILDRLVLARVRAALGGRLRYAISSGAPLSRDVLEYFIMLGLTITEAYGLTETSVITINDPKRVRPGTVGRAVEGVEIRIQEDGEILTRGPGVMQGYFKDPEATARVMEGDWFHTGDVGSLDAEGHLSITDRKKDLIITSGGKNVAPQTIENAIRSTGMVAQAVLIGNGRRFLSALLVPEPESLARMCRETGVPPAPVESAIAHPEIVAAYERAVRAALRDFAAFEQVRKITLLPRDFSIESGELTPTLKARRREIEARYRAQIEAMYGDEGPDRP
jgi:long-chain acyl-CoA synthetase